MSSLTRSAEGAIEVSPEAETHLVIGKTTVPDGSEDRFRHMPEEGPAEKERPGHPGEMTPREDEMVSHEVVISRPALDVTVSRTGTL